MKISFTLDLTYFCVERTIYTVCKHADWEHGRGHRCYHDGSCEYPEPRFRIVDTNIGKIGIDHIPKKYTKNLNNYFKNEKLNTEIVTVNLNELKNKEKECKNIMRLLLNE